MNYIKQLGPGLMYAGAAVGVSHLIQSTRAGASYGFDLLLAVIIINILKYPFFEVGTRYTAATGKTLIEGYRRIGNWAIILIFIQSIATMFIVIAAITLVSSGIAPKIIPLNLSINHWALLVTLSISSILILGTYKWLNIIVKWIIILLTITSIFALILSIKNYDSTTIVPSEFSFTKKTSILFLITLLGWMPAPLDISIWQSLWQKSDNKKSFSTKMLDFKVGYWTTTLLACVFLLLGAFTLYGKDIELSSKSTVFAGQLIDMYTSNIGNWSFYLVGFAAFATMFSTSITVTDAYPRVITEILNTTNVINPKQFNNTYKAIIIVSGAISLIIIWFYTANMKELVGLITSISFTLVPIIAFLNLIVMNSSDVPEDKRPSKRWNYFAKFSLTLLTLFSAYYLFII